MKNKGYLCSNLQKHADVGSIEDVHLSKHPVRPFPWSLWKDYDTFPVAYVDSPVLYSVICFREFKYYLCCTNRRCA